MKNDYTHIAIVLDRSGSMASIKSDTIGGFNNFLETNRAVDLPCTLTLVQFDSEGIDTIRDAMPVKDVPPLTDKTFEPRASTPLYDAIGQTIVKSGDFLHRLPEAQRPGKVIFVIITDGMENASKEYGLQQVRDMLKHQQDVYKWQVVFLGANIDSHAVGASAGIHASNVMNYANNAQGVSAAYSSVARNVRGFRTGTKMDMAFTPEQKKDQADAGADE